MDIVWGVFLNALFFVLCGFCAGALVGSSITYLVCHPEPDREP